MSKTIRVEESVYEELDLLRSKRETFCDVIGELLVTRGKTLEFLGILEGQIKFREWQHEQLEKQKLIF